MIAKKFLLFVFGFVTIIFSARLSNALETVRVATSSLTSPSILYLLMAQREGYFKEEGLNPEVINIRGEIAVKTAITREIAFFIHAGSGLVAAVRGLPIKIL